MHRSRQALETAWHSYLYSSDGFVGKLQAWLAGQTSHRSPFRQETSELAKAVQAVAAGALVLGVALSAQQRVEEDLQNALFPTSFDAQHPELLSEVNHRQRLLAGEQEIGFLTPFTQSFGVSRPPCRLIGHVRSEDTVNLRLHQPGLPEVKQKIEGFGRVDILLNSQGTHGLTLVVPRLLSKDVSTEQELMCFTDP